MTPRYPHSLAAPCFVCGTPSNDLQIIAGKAICRLCRTRVATFNETPVHLKEVRDAAVERIQANSQLSFPINKIHF